MTSKVPYFVLLIHVRYFFAIDFVIQKIFWRECERKREKEISKDTEIIELPCSEVTGGGDSLCIALDKKFGIERNACAKHSCLTVLRA